VNTDGDSRQTKKQSVERQEVAGLERERAAEARESGLSERTSTQGYRKAWQRVQDLSQNEEFLAELAAIQAIPDSDWRKRSRKLFKFAEENGLDLFMGSALMRLLGKEKPLPWDPSLDFCQIVDEPDEIFNDTEGDLWATRPRPLPDHRLTMMLHPIHICISPLATKRDVLDFVAKRWREIRDLLDAYSEGEPTVRKRRKEARDQFILEHWEVPSKELADMVCEKFPGELLTYADINAIRQYLKKRYSKP